MSCFACAQSLWILLATFRTFNILNSKNVSLTNCWQRQSDGRIKACHRPTRRDTGNGTSFEFDHSKIVCLPATDWQKKKNTLSYCCTCFLRPCCICPLFHCRLFFSILCCIFLPLSLCLSFPLLHFSASLPLSIHPPFSLHSLTLQRSAVQLQTCLGGDAGDSMGSAIYLMTVWNSSHRGTKRNEISFRSPAVTVKLGVNYTYAC